MKYIQQKYIFAPSIRDKARLSLLIAFALIPFVQSAAIAMLMVATLFHMPLTWRRNELFFLYVLLAFFALYYLWGAREIAPDPLNARAAISRFVSSFVVILSLFSVSKVDAKKAIQILCASIVLFVFITGVWTILFEPLVASQRWMASIYTNDETASTGLINSMAVSVGVLLFWAERKTIGVLSLLLLATIAMLYANRTGQLISAAYVAALLVQMAISKRAWYTLTIISILLLVYPLTNLDIVSSLFKFGLSRFYDEGFTTERTDVFTIGIDHIFSGNYLFGGAQLAYGWSPWYHNLFLDAYRVAGLPALMVAITLTLMTFLNALKSKSGAILFVWLIAFLIMMTSIPMEAAFVEFAINFAIFAYAIINRRFINGNSNALPHYLINRRTEESNIRN